MVAGQMLTSILYWAQVAGTVVDIFLLLRILNLRLQKTYLLITLACLVTVIFDLADVWFVGDDLVRRRLFFYSRFLYVFLFPATAFEVFEEMKERIAKVRRMAIGRLISGLVFTVALSLILLAMFDDSNGGSEVLPTMAVVLWAGASTASLSFLVTMHRVLRSQPLGMPGNTGVWLFYYEFTLGAEVLSCLLLLIVPLLKITWIADPLDLAFIGFGISITIWCIVRLRRLPGEDARPARVQIP